MAEKISNFDTMNTRALKKWLASHGVDYTGKENDKQLRALCKGFVADQVAAKNAAAEEELPTPEVIEELPKPEEVAEELPPPPPPVEEKPKKKKQPKEKKPEVLTAVEPGKRLTPQQVKARQFARQQIERKMPKKKAVGKATGNDALALLAAAEEEKKSILAAAHRERQAILNQARIDADAIRAKARAEVGE